MKNNKLSTKFATILLCCGLFSSVFANSFNKIYAFGDSLSDNGNLYALSQHDIPRTPYYNGRFSNGPVWPEYLAKQYNFAPTQLVDFAIGGSFTSAEQPQGMLQQVSEYLKSTKKADPSGLYTLWSGGNNYLYGEDIDDDYIQQAVDDIVQAAKLLVEQGANNILIFDLPDFKIAPWARMMDESNNNQDFSRFMTQVTKAHDDKLKTAVQKLITKAQVSSPNTRIVLVDANQLFNNVMQNPQITNVTDACYPGDLLGSDPDSCNNPQNYLFWDSVHPTTYAHQLFSEMLQKTLAENKITPYHQPKESISERLRILNKPFAGFK